jgi:hypothetical protein
MNTQTTATGAGNTTAAQYQVGEIVRTPALGCWSNGKIVSIDGGYLNCTDPKHGGAFRVHSSRVRKIATAAQELMSVSYRTREGISVRVPFDSTCAALERARELEAFIANDRKHAPTSYDSVTFGYKAEREAIRRACSPYPLLPLDLVIKDQQATYA